MLGQQRRQPVVAVDPHRAHPGQWLSPTWSTTTRPGSTPSTRGEQALKPDRDIAEADRPMALVEQARVTMPTGFVKSTIQRSGRRQLTHALGDLEHDGDRAHRLGKATGAGRLLADATAGERRGLVMESSGLPTDANLEQDEIRPLDCRVQVIGDREPTRVARMREHPSGHPADHLAPFGVDVVQDEVVHSEARKA